MDALRGPKKYLHKFSGEKRSRKSIPKAGGTRKHSRTTHKISHGMMFNRS